jgi:glycosyltransferase involved in cell wall biosynthesis
MPKVSVIIPAYNVERYIAQAIASVLAQSWTDFELLVIDDGGADASAAIARATPDARVRVISQPNRGLAGARNTGIRAAQGQYLAFLDADDLWAPSKLAQHVAHLDADPDVGVSYSASAFINDAGQPLHYGQHPKLSGVSARDVLLRNPVGNGSAPVIRRSALQAISFAAPSGPAGERWYFDERFRQSEDIECWMRIALCTPWQFAGLGQALTLYRVNAGGLSAQLERQLASWEAMVSKLSLIAPAFMAEHAPAARGYQLRYLARRAVRLGDARGALRLLGRGLASHPRMLWEEPGRTLSTLAAAALRGALPERWWQPLEALGMQWAERLKTRHAPAVWPGATGKACPP